MVRRLRIRVIEPRLPEPSTRRHPGVCPDTQIPAPTPARMARDVGERGVALGSPAETRRIRDRAQPEGGPECWAACHAA